MNAREDSFLVRIAYKVSSCCVHVLTTVCRERVAIPLASCLIILERKPICCRRFSLFFRADVLDIFSNDSLNRVMVWYYALDITITVTTRRLVCARCDPADLQLSLKTAVDS